MSASRSTQLGTNKQYVDAMTRVGLVIYYPFA